MCGSEGRWRQVLPHMKWQICMLPMELISEKVAPPQYKRNDKEKSWALARMNWSLQKCHWYCEVHAIANELYNNNMA